MLVAVGLSALANLVTATKADKIKRSISFTLDFRSGIEKVWLVLMQLISSLNFPLEMSRIYRVSSPARVVFHSQYYLPRIL